METLKFITSNYLINVSLIAWCLAQSLKVLFFYLKYKRMNWERFIGSGGMPSSHSAFVCALAVGALRKFGFDSPIFAISFVLAIVVMCDATGVRRAAGEHAKVLNRILSDYRNQKENLEKEDIPDQESGSYADKILKEFLGHTPLEVLSGALLGILVAIVTPVI